MARNTKKPRTYVITAATSFENFRSLSLVDAGETDGFQVKGDSDDSVWIFIPTGLPYNIGADDESCQTKLYLQAATGKNLNVSATVLY
jgi:hypothetical protein